MNLLTQRLVLAEAAQLLREGDPKLGADDLSFNGDMLVCKGIPGGLVLTDTAKQMSVDEFSRKLLVPFLARMTRLRALQEDLAALGMNS